MVRSSSRIGLYYVMKLISGAGSQYRVGDYRILYEIQDNTLFILVVEVGHRREVYRK